MILQLGKRELGHSESSCNHNIDVTTGPRSELIMCWKDEHVWFRLIGKGCRKSGVKGMLGWTRRVLNRECEDVSRRGFVNRC